MPQELPPSKPFNPGKRNDGPAGCSNGERADRASTILTRYKRHTLREDGPVGRDDITDLLTDLFHYCDRDGLDMDCCIDLAQEHYSAER